MKGSSRRVRGSSEDYQSKLLYLWIDISLSSSIVSDRRVSCKRCLQVLMFEGGCHAVDLGGCQPQVFGGDDHARFIVAQFIISTAVVKARGAIDGCVVAVDSLRVPGPPYRS